MRVIVIAVFLMLLGCSSNKGFEPINVPVTSESVALGRSLFNGVAACGFCHGEKAQPNSLPVGGRVQYDLYGEVRAANLTPSKSGLGEWQPKQILTAIRDGVGRDGAVLSPGVHRGMEWMADADVMAIIAFLTTLPPSENVVERRDLGFVSRNTTGFFQGRRDVGGYVPKVDAKHELVYGKYLLENVARCTYCHSTPSSVLSSEAYLQGGHTMRFEQGDKLVPGIGNSTVNGIGGWSENEVVTYLRSGMTPDRRKVDNQFCPVGFYALASDADLMAIARYLKSDLSAK